MNKDQFNLAAGVIAKMVKDAEPDAMMHILIVGTNAEPSGNGTATMFSTMDVHLVATVLREFADRAEEVSKEQRAAAS